MAPQHVMIAIHQLGRVRRPLLTGAIAMALLPTGCSEPAVPVDGGVEEIRIGDRTFKLELALSSDRRRRGLGG